MKKIQVEITGETPLLMHSAKAMVLETQGKIRKTTKEYNHEEEAEKVAYRKKDGKLYVPFEAIYGCMINASSWKKVGKYALKPIMAGAIRIEPMEIGLGTKKYEIDLRTVVIKRNRVVRARPRINKWKINFTIVYNENMIKPDLIKEVLKEGGERVGILDFSPRNRGSFGTFKITKWKVLK